MSSIIQIKKSQTLFILDWDDTLFPTNWVMKNGINLMNSSTRDQYIIYFQELDRTLSSFIKKLTQMGKVIIVTNALLDWIHISSVVLPKTYTLLKKVKIVSARGTYKNKSQKMMDWKMMAFRDVVDEEFKNDYITNVISIGDAEYEYQALIALSNRKRNTPKYLKSVRFMKNPSHDTLIDQLEVLSVAINAVWEKQNHLDLLFNLHSSRHRC
jgi:hypothetical protein